MHKSIRHLLCFSILLFTAYINLPLKLFSQDTQAQKLSRKERYYILAQQSYNKISPIISTENQQKFVNFFYRWKFLHQVYFLLKGFNFFSSPGSSIKVPASVYSAAQKMSIATDSLKIIISTDMYNAFVTIFSRKIIVIGEKLIQDLSP